jgi:hypothetical protein
MVAEATTPKIVGANNVQAYQHVGVPGVQGN